MNFLTEHQENQSEAEKKFLRSNLNHRRFIHHRVVSAILSIMLIGFGVGLIEESMLCAATYTSLWFWIGVGAEVALFTWLAIPCRCGKVPILTNKGRRQFLRITSRRYKVATCSVAGVIGLLCGFSVSAFGIYAFGPLAAIFVLGTILLLFGCFVAVLTMLGKNELLIRRHVVSQTELQEMAGISGDTEANLQRLIQFHMKCGNFAAADQCSVQLLARAENTVV